MPLTEKQKEYQRNYMKRRVIRNRLLRLKVEAGFIPIDEYKSRSECLIEAQNRYFIKNREKLNKQRRDRYYKQKALEYIRELFKDDEEQ